MELYEVTLQDKPFGSPALRNQSRYTMKFQAESFKEAEELANLHKARREEIIKIEKDYAS